MHIGFLPLESPNSRSLFNGGVSASKLVELHTFNRCHIIIKQHRFRFWCFWLFIVELLIETDIYRRCWSQRLNRLVWHTCSSIINSWHDGRVIHAIRNWATMSTPLHLIVQLFAIALLYLVTIEITCLPDPILLNCFPGDWRVEESLCDWEFEWWWKILVRDCTIYQTHSSKIEIVVLHTEFRPDTALDHRLPHLWWCVVLCFLNIGKYFAVGLHEGGLRDSSF